MKPLWKVLGIVAGVLLVALIVYLAYAAFVQIGSREAAASQAPAAKVRVIKPFR